MKGTALEEILQMAGGARGEIHKSEERTRRPVKDESTHTPIRIIPQEIPIAPVLGSEPPRRKLCPVNLSGGDEKKFTACGQKGESFPRPPS